MSLKFSRRKVLLSTIAASSGILAVGFKFVNSTTSKTVIATNKESNKNTGDSAMKEDLQALSTKFDNPEALQGWQEFQVEGWVPKWESPRVEKGQLFLQPRSSGWFEDNYAGHLYREVDGDFIVTTRINVQGTKSPVPQRSFSLAGIFIRQPREFTRENWDLKGENWMFFSTGTAFPAGKPHFEIKSTYNSLSTLKISEAPTGWMRLRVARSGELFTLLYQQDGSQEWQILDQFIRPDLPQKLNVGLTAYADWDSLAANYPNYREYNEQGAATQNADLIAYVESIDFRRPVTPRFPIATLDPQFSFDTKLAEARLQDLTS
ncbi:MAG: hypothetical protein AAFY21_00470 [Cyanobacteria bacterium J06641_2]